MERPVNHRFFAQLSTIAALLAVLAAPAAATTPPAPSQPSAHCDVVVGGHCYVNGVFTISSFSSGADHYKVCRSSDTLGWGGCEVTITSNAGPSITVSGSHLPSDGYRRAYRFSACDSANNCTAWSANTATYVYMDQSGPTTPGPTSVSCAYATASPSECWVLGSFTASVSPAADGGSGVASYQVCRSNDSTGGNGGCQYTMTINAGTSYTVSGTNLPSDGYRRAYYFRARDRVGNWGPWNTPRYVRVDRYPPLVSATNASDSWYTSLTATVSASDSKISAAANSGLAAVRYRWNAPLDAACTAGTATSSGAALTAPEGDNTLYLCARDRTGHTKQWSGRYRVDSGGPTAPGPTTVGCNYTTTSPNECWVQTSFTATVTPATDAGSGVAGYRVCRSEDSTGGNGGCQVTLTYDTGTSWPISGTDLPSDGYRRAYYFKAKDALGNWGPWNTPRYVRVDRHPPTVSASNASNTWYASRTATVTADDAVGGAAANAGLQWVRYRWNAAHNAACTSGTVTSSGAVLTVPAGDNTLYLCARDQTGRTAQWSGNYRVDGAAPVLDSVTVSDSVWSIGDRTTYNVTLKASDVSSGVRELRALINYQGSNAANPRGFFSWRDASLGYLWSADRVACTGGGFASKHPTSYNPDTIKLVGCSTTLTGSQRTVTLTVEPQASFGEFGPINDISLRAWDLVGLVPAWTSWDLNFSSLRRGAPRIAVSYAANPPLPYDGTLSWAAEPQAAGSSVDKAIKVQNVAPAGSSNLLLEHAPSNIEIENLAGNAFSLAGTLLSPLTVGQSDNFVVKMSTATAGDHRARVKIWHDDTSVASPFQFEVRGTVVAAPTVTSISPDLVLAGQTTNVTVQGTGLTDATVMIGTRALDPEAPPRVYPTAQLLSVNPAGTSMTVRIDATAAGIDGYYSLGATTVGGAAAGAFRVVQDGPVIDFFSPAEAAAGSVYALAIAGVHLEGATVTSSEPGISILELDNTDDELLTGLLHLSSSTPIGDVDLEIHGRDGGVTIPLQTLADPSGASLPTKRLPGSNLDPGGPAIYFQEPVTLLPGVEWSSAVEHAAATGPTPKPFGDCIPFNAGRQRSRLRHFIVLYDPTNPRHVYTPAELASLPAGTDRIVGVDIVQFFFYFEISIFGEICFEGPSDFDVCTFFHVEAVIPKVGGESTEGGYCGLPFGSTRSIGPTGEITSYLATATGCLQATDIAADPTSGKRQLRLQVTDGCCGGPGTLTILASGWVYSPLEPFSVSRVTPVGSGGGGACCTTSALVGKAAGPTPCTLRVFLDVDGDNLVTDASGALDLTHLYDEDEIDDSGGYLPCSTANGASVSPSGNPLQQASLIAAYVDAQSSQLRIVAPPAGVTAVEVALDDTSMWPGKATNYPPDPDAQNDEPDFWLGSATMPRQMVNVNFSAGNHPEVAVTHLFCNDYGGSTTVRVTADDGTVAPLVPLPKPAAGSGTPALPAIGWTGYPAVSVQPGSLQSLSDGETVPAGANNGDGFSAYSEYRGFVVAGSHLRLNPRKKDFFVFSATTQPDLGLAPSMGMNILVPADSELYEIPGTGIRFVNVHGAADFDDSRLIQAVDLVFTTLPIPPSGSFDLGVTSGKISLFQPVISTVYTNRIASVSNQAPQKLPLAGLTDWTIGHELGHAVDICHRQEDANGSPVGTCDDGATIVPAAVVPNGVYIMHSGEVFNKIIANKNGHPATSYHGNSLAQIKLRDP